MALLASLIRPVPATAAEGIPGWNKVLEDVLKRAEAEAASKPVPDHRDRPAQLGPQLQPAVAEFVRYYQGAGAGAWAGSMRRLSAIRPLIERTFENQGVPAALLWLGLVESGYDPAARSPRQAVGVWQLIPGTARRFGLSLGPADERTDAVKATRAAAQYLRFLYDRFGDWNLALAAYNAGEARVDAAIARSGVRDFWALAERGYLPRETRAYVPAVLAAQYLGGADLTTATAVAERSKPLRGGIVQAPFSISE